MTTPPPAERYEGFDLLRALAMFLGLAYHAAWAWVPGIGRWYVVGNPQASPAFVTLTGLLHAFRLPLFFLLSGFFGALGLERRGARGFLLDRARRLLVPLLVAAPLVMLADWGTRQWALREGTLSADYPGGAGWLWRPSHLWFLEGLFLLCLATVGLGSLLRPRAGARLVAPEGLLWLVVPTALLRVWLPESKPSLSWWPEPAALLDAALFFGTGAWLYTRRAWLPQLRRLEWMLPAGLALGLWLFSGPEQWEPRGVALSALVSWLVVLGATGLSTRLRSAPRPWLERAVASSYWVYLVHYPLVVAVHQLLLRTHLPAVVGYGLTVGAVALLALGSWRLVAPTSVGQALGARRPRRLRA